MIHFPLITPILSKGFDLRFVIIISKATFSFAKSMYGNLGLTVLDSHIN